MIVDEVEKNILVHELQLGEQLNKSVHDNRRSDFSLVLAMLTDDVLAHSQFSVPKTEVIHLESNDELLRKELNLPKLPRLSLENVESITEFNQANFIVENRIQDLHLTDALNPKPLSFRNDAKHILHNILSNTSLYCQHKYSNKEAKSVNNKRLAFNAKGWLDVIQETIIKSPLIRTV